MPDNERKHFEGHGDHWIAFTEENSTDVLSKYLQKTAQEGKLVEHCLTKLENDKVILSTIYPDSGDVQICSTMSNCDNDEALEIMTFHPVFEGVENDIIVNDTHTWKNKVEGEVSASVGAVNLSFFAPYYYSEFATAKKGEALRVNLAGLAITAENAEAGCEITEGEFYEMALQNFLEENPDKTRKDFPSVSVSFDGLPILFSRDFYSEYEFRGKIHESTDVSLNEYKFKKVKICVGRKDDPTGDSDMDDDFFINLYISQYVGDACDLNVGNDIQGILWLTGIRSN